jgi:hypothetical protein
VHVKGEVEPELNHTPGIRVATKGNISGQLQFNSLEIDLTA